MELAGSVRWLVGLLLVGAVGCGNRGLVPVEGVVTLDGKPLAAATVTLRRDSTSLADRSFSGVTDETGRFHIMTADGRASGAVPGEYRVFITSLQLPPTTNEFTPIPPDRVPPQWRDGSQSFTVPDDGTAEANFSLKTSLKR